MMTTNEAFGLLNLIEEESEILADAIDRWRDSHDRLVSFALDLKKADGLPVKADRFDRLKTLCDDADAFFQNHWEHADDILMEINDLREVLEAPED